MAESEKIPPAQFLEELLKIIETGENGRKELAQVFLSLKKDGKYPSFATPLLRILEQANQEFSRSIDNVNDPDLVESPDIYGLVAMHLELVKITCDQELFNISSFNFDLLLHIITNKSNLYHIIGYAAAEHYIGRESGWLESLPAIFQFPNEKALAKLIENEEFKKWAESNEAVSGLIELIEKLEEIYKKVNFSLDEVDEDLSVA